MVSAYLDVEFVHGSELFGASSVENFELEHQDVSLTCNQLDTNNMTHYACFAVDFEGLPVRL